MKDLIEQYTKIRKTLEESKVGATEKDISIINEMISDINYSLEWMHTAKQPGKTRGIERRAAYEREKPCDPLLMQRYVRSTVIPVYEWDTEVKESVISEWDRIQLEDALSTLTEREKEIYIMSRGYGFTQDKISNLLKLQRTTVQEYLKRADKKIGERMSGSLFCIR
ncbi:sigma-70 family RNA polymerase sigma factor [Bacillus thuringiensis]|uniref:sigma-70 family RNA polymerase sigma factor n=1 Tax=Bacillus cereus group TaxID=86661 RepID=UPI001298AA42|nr:MULTISPECIES: sigma-70 family RNA polymerase sigma factor [Bacillus cereus group]MEB8859235.1 sigma-70 family RNA polymerase sigma factor [Bacillus cereus]MDR5046499.1 sigma-70 family RNA polymerase sigma factor [Bacillus thuringiensis]MEB9434658.1 sigma-70 family RNA polymerase sigma factor [Bacillus cereus]MEB9481927.1 sigma-70 family RNA polymerase sigma factor [Bacillus cereus]MEC2466779.1 sigma-70 family RNA polymerase sigma factor [Bacillus cereus]